jgi:hypothetical protein
MAAHDQTGWHPLRAILHAQVASDKQAAENLRYTLVALSKETLAPSSHLQKWTARLSSLLYSREPFARWAGLSLALRTSELSKSIMIECAQTWITATLPLLSVRGIAYNTCHPF